MRNGLLLGVLALLCCATSPTRAQAPVTEETFILRFEVAFQGKTVARPVMAIRSGVAALVELGEIKPVLVAPTRVDANSFDVAMVWTSGGRTMPAAKLRVAAKQEGSASMVALGQSLAVKVSIEGER